MEKFSWETLRELVIIFVVLAVLIATPILLFVYFSSCKQAGIYNQQNNTNYTCSDFFWASEQINQKTQTIKID